MTIVLRGGEFPTGAYLLHIHCPNPLTVTFGRFEGGRPISLDAGDYIYVGSAMGRGAAGLAGRLIRHATRCAPGAPPHAIRDALLTSFRTSGLPSQPPRTKRLHWHIDYLLEKPPAELADVWAVRSAESLEAELATRLASHTALEPVARGLGASDHRGATHLLYLTPPMDWVTLVQWVDSWALAK
ncbi:MAG: GIY-YIG nuclease family protein [Chloroflexota bacterium]